MEVLFPFEKHLNNVTDFSSKSYTKKFLKLRLL